MKRRALLVDDPPRTKPILTAGGAVRSGGAVDIQPLYHYTGELGQTDLPAGSYLTSACVDTKQNARELTGALFPHGPIKRRAVWLEANLLDGPDFEGPDTPSVALWAWEYCTRVVIPSVYFDDLELS